MDKVKSVKDVEKINVPLLDLLLRKEYMKLYKNTLFSINEATIVDKEEGIYELPKDENGFVKKFNAIVTSLAPFVDTTEEIENYYDFWNRPEIASLFFCGTFIGRNMNSTAQIPHLCFGFWNLSDDSLLMSDNGDLYSSNVFMHASSRFIPHFLAPENQLKYTKQTNHGIFLNEMGIRRIVNNRRIQPDFLIAFRTDGVIPNMEEIKKARKQFLEEGIDVPILIIDRDECLKAEAYEIAGMILEYQKHPSKKLKQAIRLKIGANSKTMAFIKEYENKDYRGKFRELIGKYFEERSTLAEEIDESFVDVNKEQLAETTNSKAMTELMGISTVIDRSVDDVYPTVADMKSSYAFKVKDYKATRTIWLEDVLESAEEIKPLFEKAEKVQSQNHSLSDDHGIQHIKNVLLMTNYIGKRDGLSEEDLAIVREAAIYHDISHILEGVPSHAESSAKLYQRKVNSALNKQEVAYLIHAHEARNEEELTAILLQDIPNIDNKRKMELIKLAKILQDADRLDIIRYDDPDYENEKYRFDPNRLNDKNNLELMAASIELNLLQKIERGRLVIEGKYINKCRPKRNTVSKETIGNLIDKLIEDGNGINILEAGNVIKRKNDEDVHHNRPEE